MSEIFNSYFTLKYNNKEIEEAYQVMLRTNIKRRNIIYTLLILAIAIACNIMLWYVTSIFVRIFEYIIISFILTGILLINLILSITGNEKINIIISYLNFYLLLYAEVSLRAFVINANADTVLICLVYTIQYLFILTWYYTCTIDFLPGCLITVAKCISLYVVFAPLSMSLTLQFRFSINQVLMLIVLILSFFYVYEKRKSFYYFKTAEMSKQWYHNILDNMNTGFMSINNDWDIQYINKSLLRIMDNIVRDNNICNTQYQIEDRPINSNDKHFINKVILENLFKSQQFAYAFVFNENDDSLEKIKDYLKFSSSDNFILIGTNTIALENSNLHFEVYGRYYTSRTHQNQKIENFEFIFNDITRVKSNEEINAELKFKSMFLAKVAHEFKNPILCITELADQVGEKIVPLISSSPNPDNNRFNSIITINEIIASIKSMSDYLFILIKDMDFFSIKAMNMKKKATRVDKEVVNMKNLLFFLKNITNILLKKFNKENTIKFSISHNMFPREIYTDEIKLKQILINLLSNAVKYTMSGSIDLNVKHENNKVKFTVIDTGRGISEKQRPALFQPFMEQNKEYGHIGAGLGLSIVKELIELLSSEIKYEPNLPQGSKFSFEIDIQGHSQTNIALTSINLTNSNNHNSDNNGYKSEDSFDAETVEVDFNPTIGVYNRVIQSQSKFRPENSHSLDSAINFLPNHYNIIVVDDEVITRKSTIRLLENFCKSYNLHVNFIEANDGIECLCSYYHCFKNNEKVSLILSDQYMTLMDGASCAKALYHITGTKNINPVKFFLLTAFETFQNEKEFGIESIYTKPLLKKNMEEIFIKSNLI
jgi:signal transduction histidine kinase/CheY-like chemotaxis protein